MNTIANQNLDDLDDEALVRGVRDLFRVYRGEAPAPKVWEKMRVDVKATLRAWMLEAERRGLYEDRPDGRRYTHVPNARARIERDSREIRERLEKRLREKR
jgi:hypothetical protein